MKNRVVALILSAIIILNILTGFKSESPAALSLKFVGEEKNKLEFVYSGLQQSVDIAAEGNSVNAEIEYFDSKGVLLEQQPVCAGNYKVKAVANAGNSVKLISNTREIQFIITKKELNFSADDIEVTNGAPYNPMNWFFKGTLLDTEDYSIDITYGTSSGKNFTSVQPSTPGIYTVKYTLNSLNHKGSCTAALRIKANAQNELNLTELNHVYDKTPKAAVISGHDGKAYYGTPVITYDGLKTPPVDAGEYAVRVRIPADGSQEPEELTDKLVIKKKNVQLTAQNRSFEVGEAIMHDISFGDGLAPDIKELNVYYEGIDGTVYPKSDTICNAAGKYKVTFVLNSNNFSMPEVSVVYNILPRTGSKMQWSGLIQVYGDNTRVEYTKESYQKVISINYSGVTAGGAQYNSTLQPVNAGTYTVTLVIETDGVLDEPVTETLIIRQKQVQYLPLNRQFYADNLNITHQVSAPGFSNIPGYAVHYTLNGSPADPLTDGAANYTAHFTVDDSNYSQHDIPTAVYSILNRPAPVIQNAATEVYDSTQKPAVLMISGQRAIIGEPLQISGHSVTLNSITYFNRDTSSYLAAAPVNAGLYTAVAEVGYALDSKKISFNLNFEIQKKAVTIIAEDKEFNAGQGIIEPEFDFVNSDLLPLKTEVTISYTGIDGTEYGSDEAPIYEAPVDAGNYKVTFRINSDNFTGEAIAFYVIGARTGNPIIWSNLTQTYGDNLPVEPVLESHQEFVSMTFTGSSGTSYPESTLQPTNSGRYLITLEIKSDGVTEKIASYYFLIRQKSVSLFAEDRTFSSLYEFTSLSHAEKHRVSVSGSGEVPAFTVNYTANGEPVDGEPAELGVFETQFSVSDANYLQTGQTTAVYTIFGEHPALTVSNPKVVFDNTPKAAVIGNLGSFREVTSLSYTKKTDGRGNIVPSANAVTQAPVEPGMYEVSAVIYDKLNDLTDTYEFIFEIERRQITITPDSIEAICGTSAVRVLNTDGTNARFTLSNIPAGSSVSASSMYVTYENATGENGESLLSNGGTFGPLGPLAANAPQAQIPPGSVAGKYKVTFRIDLDNYTGYAETVIVLKARSGANGEPSEVTNLSQTYGTSLAVNMTLRSWQSFEPGEGFYFEGVNGTVYEKNKIQPKDSGTYKVTRLYRTDGELRTWSGTLTINRLRVQLSPAGKTVQYHTLDTNPLTVTLADIGVPEGYGLTFSDFDILFYEGRDTNGNASSAIPNTAGTFTAVFELNSAAARNFELLNNTAVYTITSRVGTISLPETMSVQYTGSPITVAIETQSFHRDVRITYEGIEGTVYAKSYSPPVALGIYSLIVTCVTDGVNETYTCRLQIAVFVNNPVSSSVVYQTGTLVRSHYGDSNNWAEYTFRNLFNNAVTVWRADGSGAPQPVLLPGEYSYTVQTRGNIVFSQGNSGNVKIVFADRLTLYNYGVNYFENVAASWYTIYSGYTATAVDTKAYTYRYKNDARDLERSFFYQTVNAGSSTVGVRSSFGLQSYIRAGGSDFYYRATESDGQKDALSTSDPTAYWNAFSGFTERGPADNNAYKSKWGAVPSKLTAYVVNASTITAGTGVVSLNTSNSYDFEFTLNSDSHVQMKTQIEAYSGQSYGGFRGLKMRFSIDINGRIMSIKILDQYSISIPLINPKPDHTGVETFYYDNVNYPSNHKFIDPRPY